MRLSAICIGVGAAFAFATAAHAQADRLLAEGDRHADRNEYDSAIAVYGRALLVNPKFAAAYSHRGRVYRKRGDYDKAIADFDRAIHRYRSNVVVTAVPAA
jgi:tetratricopeptide (TPR) repeat protein